MSKNRIRYKKTSKENILESNQKFISKAGIPYKAIIDLNDYTYKIRNLNSDNVIKGGENINNLNVLKSSSYQNCRYYKDPHYRHTFYIRLLG